MSSTSSFLTAPGVVVLGVVVVDALLDAVDDGCAAFFAEGFDDLDAGASTFIPFTVFWFLGVWFFGLATPLATAFDFALLFPPLGVAVVVVVVAVVGGGVGAGLGFCGLGRLCCCCC
jgi:hypothetical protein